jgi:hypothetical protein
MADYFEGSEVNEAFLKMERINKVQDACNLANLNPLSLNLELGIYNYQVIINGNNALLLEAWGQLNETKRKEGVNLKNSIEFFLKNYPIIENVIDNSKGKSNEKINLDNWNILEKWIFIYQAKIKELLTEAFPIESEKKKKW